MPDPAYLMLYRELRNAITDGIFRYGSKLPSKRTIALDRGISLVTVEHACDILCDEGYIEARERSGYFVSFRSQELFSVREESSGQSRPFPASPNAAVSSSARNISFPLYARTVRRVLSTYGDTLLERSPRDGCLPLKQALAAYLARSRGIRVEAEQIIIGAGAEHFYSLIVQLLGREKHFGLEDPSYEKIRLIYEANGAVCESLKMGPDGIPGSELSRSSAGVLHVTPYNSYPSGITASASRRAEYVRWANERDAYIIEDDYDSEFTLSSKAEDTLFSLSPDGRVIYLNTFSRTAAPSLRAAYMVLPQPLLMQYRQRIGFYNCSVPVLEQYVLTELLNSGDFERHINRIRRALRRDKAQDPTE